MLDKVGFDKIGVCLVLCLACCGCRAENFANGVSDHVLHLTMTHYAPAGLRGMADGLEKVEAPERDVRRIRQAAVELEQPTPADGKPIADPVKPEERSILVDERPMSERPANERVRYMLVCNEACPPCPAWKKRTVEGLRKLGYVLSDGSDWVDAYRAGAHGICVLHSSDDWQGSYPRVVFYVDRMKHCEHTSYTAADIHKHYMELYRKCEAERLLAGKESD